MNLTSHEPPPTKGEDRLIPIREVSSLVGLRDSAIYNRIRAKRFPEPVRLSQRCSRWSRAAVLGWVEAQKEAA